MMTNSEMNPNKESVSSGASENTSMQWAQRQLNALEGELNQIDQKLSTLDKSNAIHERDISDLKQSLLSRFDKLEAILEKNSTKASSDLEKVESRINKNLDEHKAELKSLSGLTNKYVGGLAVMVFMITLFAAFIRFWSK